MNGLFLDPAAPGNLSEPAVRRTLVLRSRNGLHARPAALLINRLRPFACAITAETADAKADARSLLGLLGLAAGYGTRLAFTAVGKDAAPAMEALQRLFDTNFSEAYGQDA